MALHYDAFERRHIGPNQEQELEMLTALGYSSMQTFIADVVPASISMTEKLQKLLPAPATEPEVISELRLLANKNSNFTSVIGCGYYGTITPPVILRNVLENPAWYTAYTPYQPEISQGRLEALFAFQTLICDLTALPIANASMLDEATAAAEAMTLARRVCKGTDSAKFLIDKHVHPQTIAVVQTRAKPLGITVELFDAMNDALPPEVDIFGVLVQYPRTDGVVDNYQQLANRVHERDGLLIAASDLLSLTILK
ncbi:MAG: glycine dehydrogenase (aminomethyl-transferring), partial [Actinobacteria bacterium]|nr:glycine dehydrogenase (aminomethyl-transferring) [Actinomycetota bacterium]